MIAIQTKLTPYNYNARGTNPTYIVIHYVGAVSTARNNADYFYGGNRGASANYFVDPTEIWMVVKPTDTAWHCGGGRQSSQGGSMYGKVTNYNSIGIEMCVKKDGNGNWYYDQATLNNTRDLVQYLMRTYGIPAGNVYRHFDVTGKACPANYLTDSSWSTFKAFLTGSSASTPAPSPTPSGIAVGSKVTLSTSATTYATGQSIPSWVKGKQYTVQQVGDGKVLLKEIVSWVYTKDVGGGTTSTPSTPPSTPSTSTNITVGSKVTLSTSATTYATGQSIPNWVKGKQYTVQQVGSGKVLLKEIVSWVYTKDVGGSTTASSGLTAQQGFKEIMAGKYGSEPARTKLMLAAGYDAATIKAAQALINDYYNKR